MKLLDGIILGAGLVGGGLAAVMLFKHFQVYPLRLSNTYQGTVSEFDYQPAAGLSVSQHSSEFTTNTIPPIEPGMLPEETEWIARRNKGARWYS